MCANIPLPVTGDTIVGDLMSEYKETIRVFIHHKMMCIGCPVAHLHDLREACTEHEVPMGDFLEEVNGVINRQEET